MGVSKLLIIFIIVYVISKILSAILSDISHVGKSGGLNDFQKYDLFEKTRSGKK